MTVRSGKIVERDEVPPISWMGEQGRFLLRSEDTGGLYTFFEVTSAPGAGPPLHIHQDVDETFYVVAGRYSIQLGDSSYEAGPGGLVHGPRGVAHKFRNVSDGPSKLLVIATPGGVEGFFEGLSRILAKGGPPDPAEMMELAAAHNVVSLEQLSPR
jgi:quercetin dioxygenase-like cupin family protein